MFPTPGFLEEKMMFLLLAEGLRGEKRNPEEDEKIFPVA